MARIITELARDCRHFLQLAATERPVLPQYAALIGNRTKSGDKVVY